VNVQGRVERLAIAVPLVAVGTYGLYYSAYASYYNSFGLTPEQGGVSWPQTFGRISLAPVAVAAVAAVLVTVAWLAVAIIGLFLVGIVRMAEGRQALRTLNGRAFLHTWGPRLAQWLPPLPAWCTAGALVAFDTAYGYSQEGRPPDGDFLVYVFYLLIVWGGMAVLGYFSKSRARTVAWASAAAVLASALHLFATSAARDAAAGVQDRGEWSWFQAALGIGPQYVQVSRHTQGSSLSQEMMLLLGDNAGVHALLDCRTGQVSLVQAQNVTLVLMPAVGDENLKARWRECRGSEQPAGD
jgi:hypothetical protein